MKRSSRQFGDLLSGFGRQSEKFSRIGACIRRNFTPCQTYTNKNHHKKTPRLKQDSENWNQIQNISSE